MLVMGVLSQAAMFRKADHRRSRRECQSASGRLFTGAIRVRPENDR